jgi:hypothetical protein
MILFDHKLVIKSKILGLFLETNFTPRAYLNELAVNHFNTF